MDAPFVELADERIQFFTIIGPAARAKQAVPLYQHGESMALKSFKEGGCTVVSELLGYSETV
ncbi:hypothetical protein N7519_000754 [Penicillium mononematosum]|uniref:uncharacterized protein n=1 Tax=Penicillium mononematosum TaxID=268346 RepID=UPI00254767B3|nr:uncharacterized protein N7519_000754 [Penicillium mononematosum]KAJ6190733.1 hypothetical protein N7519_000754 [Penicillium mononematosum]